MAFLVGSSSFWATGDVVCKPYEDAYSLNIRLRAKSVYQHICAYSHLRHQSDGMQSTQTIVLLIGRGEYLSFFFESTEPNGTGLSGRKYIVRQFRYHVHSINDMSSYSILD